MLFSVSEKYVAEGHHHCQCGALMVFRFDDEQETIRMAISEALLPLACSKGLELLNAGVEYEEIEEEHELDFLLYIYSVPDDAMIW